MTNRELRTRRRAADRKAAKAALKAGKIENPTEQAASATDANASRGFVSQNANRSTGPRTPEGKLASSRNSLKHGLSTGELIIAGENPTAFETLLAALLAEYQPATVTEELLVKELAESHWLTHRALRMQNDCFSDEGVDQKRLALFLRYQTTHQRAFHKALAALTALQKDRRKQPTGAVLQSEFVSQNNPQTQPHTAPSTGFVSQNGPEPVDCGHFVSQNSPQQNKNETEMMAQAA